MGRVVLVTGVSLDLGRRLARRMAGEPAVRRVIGVDVVPPRGDLGGVRFVRADIRNPVIAKVIAGEDVDTVVHTGVVASADDPGGRPPTKESTVIGTMQLLAACQRAPGLQRLVVGSSAEVYGSSSRDPALFTEDMPARKAPKAGFARDVVEVEGYVRGFSRRRPDVTVTLLRSAPTIGPTSRSPLSRYLRLPVVPKVLGYDARLMLLHDDDLVAALHHAVLAETHGTFNVAGGGVVVLSQALRRLGRATVPVPGAALSSLSSMLPARLGLPQLGADVWGFLTFGRALDTTRLRRDLGFTPTYSTSAALADFGASLPDRLLPKHPLVVADELVSGTQGGRHG